MKIVNPYLVDADNNQCIQQT